MKKIVVLVLGLFVFSSVCLAAEAPVKSLVKIGADAVVAKGETVKDAISVGGSVIIRGEVTGNAVSVGGTVTLRPTAKVLGDAVSVGGKVAKEEGAEVLGNIVQVSPIEIMPFTPGAQAVSKIGLGILVGFGIIVFSSFLILALIITALFSRYVGNVSAKVEKEGLKSFLYGILGVILSWLIILVLALSLVGLAFIPLFILLVLGAVFIGYVAVAQLLGKKITHLFRRPGRPMWLEVTIGIIALGIIHLIPILGAIIIAIAATMGFGGVILTKCCAKCCANA
ncbi:MAG: hypothetical protein NT030_05210 [Candidatus Saganbacteria bacterium]|nr:hypothetical protein [Candidatus Saganbacteria bacterium]